MTLGFNTYAEYFVGFLTVCFTYIIAAFVVKYSELYNYIRIILQNQPRGEGRVCVM